MIFGAGGAALAVGYALGKGGATQVWIVNRSPKRGLAAAKRLKRVWARTRFVALSLERALETMEKLERLPDLSVNATPCGMKGYKERDPGFDRFWRLYAGKQKHRALAFDLIYNPERTPFLAGARSRGLRVLGGLDMLIWQAIATWEIWFGKLGQARSRKLMKRLRIVLKKELR